MYCFFLTYNTKHRENFCNNLVSCDCESRNKKNVISFREWSLFLIVILHRIDETRVSPNQAPISVAFMHVLIFASEHNSSVHWRKKLSI